MSELLLKPFFSHVFPVESIWELISMWSDPCLCEFAIDMITASGSSYVRYVSATSAEGLRQHLIDKNAKVLHIGPSYKSRVWQKGEIDCNALKMEIDVTDYDHLGINKASVGACDAAWPYVAFGCRLITELLEQAFALRNIMYAYSGRRGVHMWILDQGSAQLDAAQRRAIASFCNYTPNSSQSGDRVILAIARQYGLLDSILSFFERAAEGFGDDCPGIFETMAGTREFCERLDLEDKILELAGLTIRVWKQGSCAKRYQYLVHVFSGSRIPKWAKDKFYNVICTYVWPRIDQAVTEGMNHLLKSCFLPHPSTGRLAVPLFNLQEVRRFIPSSTPTLEQIMSDSGLEATVRTYGDKFVKALKAMRNAPTFTSFAQRHVGMDIDFSKPPPTEPDEMTKTTVPKDAVYFPVVRKWLVKVTDSGSFMVASSHQFDPNTMTTPMQELRRGAVIRHRMVTPDFLSKKVVRTMVRIRREIAAHNLRHMSQWVIVHSEVMFLAIPKERAPGTVATEAWLARKRKSIIKIAEKKEVRLMYSDQENIDDAKRFDIFKMLQKKRASICYF